MTDSGGTGSYRTYTKHVEPDRAWVVVTSSTAVLLVSVLSTLLLGLPTLVYALAVPVGVFFGVAGALGFTAGRLFFELWTNSVSLASAVHLGGDFCLVAVAYFFWNGGRIPAAEDGWQLALSGLVRYLLTGTIALLCNIAIVSLGWMFLDRIPLAASVPVLLVDRSGVVIVVGAFVLVTLWFIVGTTPATSRSVPGLTNGKRAGVAVVALVWLFGAFALSLVRQDITSVRAAEENFFAYVPATVLPIVRFILESAYHSVQALGAAVAFLIVILLLFGSRLWGLRQRQTAAE